MINENDLELCGDLIVHDYESGVAVPRELGSELERWAERTEEIRGEPGVPYVTP